MHFRPNVGRRNEDEPAGIGRRQALSVGAAAVAGSALLFRPSDAAATTPTTGIPFVDITDAPYNAVPNGTTDNSVAIQTAMDDFPDGVILYFPRGAYLANNLTLRSNITFQGDGGGTSRISSRSAKLFGQVAGVSGCTFKSIWLDAAAGHLFDTSGHPFYLCSWENCSLSQESSNFSIFHHDGSGDYVNNTMIGCVLTCQPNATVPAWYLRGNAGALNSNQWVSTRVVGSSSAYFFRIEETNSETFSYDNSFIGITAELCAGGFLYALSQQGLTLVGVTSWDTSVPYASDIFHVGKSGSVSRDITMVNCGRRGGTLASGVYDINCVPNQAERCVLINCNKSGDGTLLNLPPNTSVVMGASDGGAGMLRTSSLGVGNAAAASNAVGSLVKKIEIFNASGASLGFVPVYASIT